MLFLYFAKVCSSVSSQAVGGGRERPVQDSFQKKSHARKTPFRCSNCRRRYYTKAGLLPPLERALAFASGSRGFV